MKLSDINQSIEQKHRSQQNHTAQSNLINVIVKSLETVETITICSVYIKGSPDRFFYQ